MEFYEILIEVLIENNLSQLDLAGMLDVSQKQISLWLHDKVKPSFSNLKSICLALDISADRLFGLKDE